MLASKLRSVGVTPLQWKGALLDNHLPSQVSPSSSVVKDSSSLRDCPVPCDAVWLEIEKETLDRNEELLGRCLVGCWVGDVDRLPDLVFFGSWAKNSWFLEGNLWLSNVRENLMLLEFEFEDEAERVYSSGTRHFRGRSFCLEKWKPSVGCLEGDRGDPRHVWVRILGLPLDLWGRSLFKKFGDSCGRFVAMDENTAKHRNLKWARVLVETRGWQHPSSLQVVAGSSCYALQLWWEEEPYLSTVIPAHGSGAWKIEEEEQAPSRAKGSVDPQPSSTVFLQPEKLPPPVLGTGAPASNMTGAAARPSPARAVETGQHSLSQAHNEETGQHLDAMAHSGLACGSSFGLGLGKAQVPVYLGSSRKPLGPALSKDLGQESPSYSPRRRSGTPAMTLSIARTSQKDASPLLDAPTTAFEPSLPVEARKTPWLEASPLLEAPTPAFEPSLPVEARNQQGMLSLPSISLRGESSSSSSPFWDTGLERGRGPSSSLLISMARDVEVMPNPLSIMLKDGSTVILTKAPTSDLEKDMVK